MFAETHYFIFCKSLVNLFSKASNYLIIKMYFCVLVEKLTADLFLFLTPPYLFEH